MISRRDLLKQIGVAGAAAVAPVAPAAAASQRAATPPPAREALESLTAAESDILEAITTRLIPTDAEGPGA